MVWSHLLPLCRTLSFPIPWAMAGGGGRGVSPRGAGAGIEQVQKAESPTTTVCD